MENTTRNEKGAQTIVQRYFAEVAYEGARFSGWQSQPGQRTVQTDLEQAAAKLLRRPVSVVGSGRTDAGVHCRQQFFHFDAQAEPGALPLRYPDADFLFKLNAVLPKDVAVRRLWPVGPHAHARFGAVEREYRYFVLKAKDPFRWRHGWLCPRLPDLDRMNQAAAALLHAEDFEVFCKAKSGVKHYRCHVRHAQWRDESDALVFTVKADRFLRGMVRLVVGTLAEVGWGAFGPEEFARLLAEKDKNRLGASAPAQGLFLWSVAYPEGLLEAPKR